jgi:hypothetical protein
VLLYRQVFLKSKALRLSQALIRLKALLPDGLQTMLYPDPNDQPEMSYGLPVMSCGWSVTTPCSPVTSFCLLLLTILKLTEWF